MLYTLFDQEMAQHSSLFSNNTMKPMKYKFIIEQMLFLEIYTFYLKSEVLVTILFLLSASLPHHSPSSHRTTSHSRRFCVHKQDFHVLYSSHCSFPFSSICSLKSSWHDINTIPNKKIVQLSSQKILVQCRTNQSRHSLSLSLVMGSNYHHIVPSSRSASKKWPLPLFTLFNASDKDGDCLIFSPLPIFPLVQIF